jgi:type IV pilus assembly protein PilV
MGYRRDKNNRPGNQEGFTLLEVIIAISILTAGLLAVGTMQVSAIYGNSKANRVTEATSIAEDKLEQLLTLQYTLNSTSAHLSAGSHDGGSASGYATTWFVTDNSPSVNCKRITVTVTWNNGTNQTSLSSYLAR